MVKYKSLYMNKKKTNLYNKLSNIEYKNDEILKVKEVDGGIILPAKKDNTGKKLWAIGGVLDKNNNYIDESSTRYLFGGKYEYDQDSLIEIKEEVIFLGPFLLHWGHFIGDQISRLWYIIDNPKKYKIAYCGWFWNKKHTEIDGNYLELFNLLGIDKSQLIDITVPTKFKNIIIPDFSFIPSSFYTVEFKKIINKITTSINNKEYEFKDNIYFTRKNFYEAQNKEYGEEEIIKFFEQNNYQILSPENMTLCEQIYCFQKCKNIAAISGSITHNIMFSGDGLNVTILNKFDQINNYQMIIDHLVDIEITYVDIYQKLLPVLFGRGPFIIGVNKYLKKYAKRNNLKSKSIFIINLNIIKKYLWYFKKYKQIYSSKLNKDLLKNQEASKKKEYEKYKFLINK